MDKHTDLFVVTTERMQRGSDGRTDGWQSGARLGILGEVGP